jgi:chorismate mutase
MSLVQNMLSKMRDAIDTVDESLIGMLSKRTKIVIHIANYKKKHNIQVHQSNRWSEVLANLKQYCNTYNLDYDDVVSIWEAIHNQSKNAQLKHMKK